MGVNLMKKKYLISPLSSSLLTLIQEQSVILSHQNVHKLESLAERWTALTQDIQDRLQHLQGALNAYGPNSQHFLTGQQACLFACPPPPYPPVCLPACLPVHSAFRTAGLPACLHVCLLCLSDCIPNCHICVLYLSYVFIALFLSLSR